LFKNLTNTNISSKKKAFLIEEIKGADPNLKLVKQGKLKARPAKDLLDIL